MSVPELTSATNHLALTSALTQHRIAEPLVSSAMIEEREWLSIVNYIVLDDGEGHDFEAEALGYFWGFARATGCMLLAVEADANTHDYHLLVSFSTEEQKRQFLDLAAANELTELADDILGLPLETEIRHARGPEYVFDEEILRVARPIADRVAQLLWSADESR
jgi:hypothetical protein